MRRYGAASAATPTDSLSFSYTGTKRSGYSYDERGNVTTDPTSGTAIQWNILGLPRTISDGTDTARRVYAADGTLLAVYEGTSGTAGKVYAGSMVQGRAANGSTTTPSAASAASGTILPSQYPIPALS